MNYEFAHQEFVNSEQCVLELSYNVHTIFREYLNQVFEAFYYAITHPKETKIIITLNELTEFNIYAANNIAQYLYRLFHVYLNHGLNKLQNKLCSSLFYEKFFTCLCELTVLSDTVNDPEFKQLLQILIEHSEHEYILLTSSKHLTDDEQYVLTALKHYYED